MFHTTILFFLWLSVLAVAYLMHRQFYLVKDGEVEFMHRISKKVDSFRMDLAKHKMFVDNKVDEAIKKVSRKSKTVKDDKPKKRRVCEKEK
jgi:hypothetical protein